MIESRQILNAIEGGDIESIRDDGVITILIDLTSVLTIPEAPVPQVKEFRILAHRLTRNWTCVYCDLQYNEMRRFKMAKPVTQSSVSKTSPLMVRLDAESKQALAAAAELRRISVSDYVRTVTVAQARREIASARDQTILLSPEEQLSFWQALQSPVKLTPAQKRLGTLIRGKR